MKEHNASNKPVEPAKLDNTRRDFIRKYGKLAAITPIAVTTLMSPSTSAAPKSCRGNGTKKC